MTMDPKDCSAKVDDLTEAQLKTLGDWEKKFQEKYAQVGKVRHLHTPFTIQYITPLCMSTF